jgi:predicted  nucleic acid-binding Zn ribbon protein
MEKGMPCPKCKGKQGYKQIDCKINWFNCPECGFVCRMKHYKGKFKSK